jgi:hypothetical protein
MTTEELFCSDAGVLKLLTVINDFFLARSNLVGERKEEISSECWKRWRGVIMLDGDWKVDSDKLMIAEALDLQLVDKNFAVALATFLADSSENLVAESWSLLI